MKTLIINYRGWLFAFLMAVALSVILSHRQARDISNSTLQNLTKNQEVTSITIVENEPATRKRYMAEITLTPTALRKYSQLRASISSDEDGPHFVSLIGFSMNEVGQWKKGMADRNKIKFSFEKRY